ncbi:MAG: outer membrane protein assembly factor BamD [Bacteroidales bacterium]|nr:outer membrane protein assembly factor BamD [Bacteroidales bacterium]MBR4980196.1 outer membrane protein assembly factor BamD [Bacteroidales bacterium]MBR5907167.1 outer membrane protein assembly factor BamD [Bacteroidales bacterium]
MKKVKVFALTVLALVSLGGCKSYYESLFRTNDIYERFKGAKDYYNRGKYHKSAALFESMILLAQGTELEDSVQYFNAMSNYRYGDYITAEQNFSKFLEVFPRSNFAEEARFLRIKCLYEGTYRWELDQVPTQKAMATIAEFMYDNPQSQYYNICKAMMDEFSERLDRKAYESAKMYYTMDDYKAAHYALKGVLRDNADNRYREQVLYYTAMSSYKYALNSVKEKQKERYMTFIDDYYNFIGEFPNVSERRQLDNMFIRAQKSVGLKAGLDSSQVAAAAELAKSEGVTPRTSQKIKADRRNTRRAIKEAKKAVKEAESRNEVARRLEEEKNLNQRRAERRKEKAERQEALRIYKEAKAKQDAEKKAKEEAEKATKDKKDKKSKKEKKKSKD